MLLSNGDVIDASKLSYVGQAKMMTNKKYNIEIIVDGIKIPIVSESYDEAQIVRKNLVDVLA